MSWLWRKKRTSKDDLPTAPTLDVAVQMVTSGLSAVTTGALRVTALKDGGYSVQPETDTGGIEVAIRYLNSMRRRVAGSGQVVRLYVSADLPISWMAAGTRLTNFRLNSVYESFGNEHEAREWLKTARGRAAASVRTFRWSVHITPSRWRQH